MELISPLALLFGLAAVVPLVLHLYHRRKRLVIEFSTNRFFTEAIYRAQRRLQVRRILLLLLRMAACVLLALALARPMMNLAGLARGHEGRRDLVILLDDSFSMQTVDDPSLPPGRRTTRFDRARRLAVEALARLRWGDRAAVLTFTGRAAGRTKGDELLLASDLKQLGRDVELLGPTYAGGDAFAALRRAAGTFKKSDERIRLLLVLSDLQAGDWRLAAWPQPLRSVATTVVQLGPKSSENLVAESISLGQGAPVVNQPVLVHARLVNYRPETASTELKLSLDGKEVTRRVLSLTGQSAHVESIPLTFETPGEHRLAVELSGGDTLPADNTCYAVVAVQPQISVLVVDGRAGGKPEESPAYFIETALQAASGERRSVQVRTCRPSDLPAKLETYRVVMLSNVKSLAMPQVQQLEAYVAGGGGLAVFLGNQVEMKFYNEVLAAADRPHGGLLPCSLLAMQGPKESLPARHILDADVEHPVLQRFDGPLRSALAGVNVYKSFAVTPREAWVVASMEDRLPLILDRGYGQGRVVLFATSPETDWSNLPQRRFFVPLVNQTVTYLARRDSARLEDWVGQDLVLVEGKWDYTQPPEVVRPDRSKVPAAVKFVDGQPVGYLPASQVTQPGFYVAGTRRVPTADVSGTLRVPSGEVLSDAADGTRRVPVTMADGTRSVPATLTDGTRSVPDTLFFAVNVPRRESDPGTLEAAKLCGLTGDWRVATFSPAGDKEDESRQLDTVAGLLRFGQVRCGVWDLLMLVVLAILLVEPLVANRLVRAAVGGGEGKVRRQTPVLKKVA